MKIRTALPAAIFFLFLGVWANAAVVTIRYTGTVTSTDSGDIAIAEVQAGESVSGTFTFDTDSQDVLPGNSSLGLYETDRITSSVGGFDFSSPASTIAVTDSGTVIPGEPPADAYQVFSPFGIVEGPALSGLSPLQIRIDLVDTGGDGSVFVDDSLPSSLDLDSFDIVSEEPFGNTGGRLIFESGSNSEQGEIRFRVDSLSIGGAFLLIYPHIAAENPWETEIGLINMDDIFNFSGTLTAYDQSGVSVSTLPVKLNPRGRLQVMVNSQFTNPSRIRYIILTSEQQQRVTGYLKFSQGGELRVAIPAVRRINSGKILVSHIASSEIWATGLNLLNTTDEEKNLEIRFDNGEVFEKNLPAGNHFATTVRDIFGGVPKPEIESAEILFAGGVVGLEVFMDLSANTISGVLLKDETSSEIYYPHIVGDSEWDTGIVAYNPNEENVQMTVESYSVNGSFLGEQVMNVGPKEKVIGTAGPGPLSLNLPEETAWMRIRSIPGVTGFELFSAENRLGGYTAEGSPKSEGVFVKLEKEGATGIAFVNPNQADAQTTLKAINNQGEVVAEKDFSVPAFSKVVDIPDDLFDNLDISEATYIHFSSSQELTGFQLNNSRDDRMLDALPAL